MVLEIGGGRNSGIRSVSRKVEGGEVEKIRVKPEGTLEKENYRGNNTLLNLSTKQISRVRNAKVLWFFVNLHKILWRFFTSI